MVHKSKTRSKRKTLRQKYSLEKAKKVHKEKMIKAIKKNPNLRLGAKRKDPGIPNLFPFKDALLDAAERRKERLEEEALVAKERRRREQVKKRREQAKSLLARAAAGPSAADDAQAASGERELRVNRSDHQRRGWYLKELRRTMEEADVVLEVLDARDPLGCRCPAVEKLITGRLSAQAGKAKRVILVLNKIDLVPPEVAARWVDYLRAEFPTVAFKASTQRQNSHLGQSRGSSLAATSAASAGSSGAGAGKLSQLLKEMSVVNGARTHVTVGVIGYPNVGKSSVINTLKRSRAAGVGSTPGLTKEVTQFKLDRNITLLDSPGVLFSASEEQDPGLVLRNCLKVEDLEDPVGAVRVMLEKCPAEEMMMLYKVPAFGSADEFLYHVAKLRGKLRPGGVPDLEVAARLVLQDWNKGIIQYYTEPPEARRPRREDVANEAVEEEAKVVDSFAPEFDINKLVDEHNSATFAAMGKAASRRGAGTFVRVAPSAPPAFSWSAGGAGEDDAADADMGGDAAQEAGAAAPQYRVMPKKKANAPVEDADAAAPQISAEDEHNAQANRNRKKEQKRLRKQRGKAERRSKKAGGDDAAGWSDGEDETGDATMGGGAAAAVDTDAAYDFDADWQD